MIRRPTVYISRPKYRAVRKAGARSRTNGHRTDNTSYVLEIGRKEEDGRTLLGRRVRIFYGLRHSTRNNE